tara:strand:+ start:108 stop:290 length:183 start_codon:yes stop_codon:yes gene_type:complete
MAAGIFRVVVAWLSRRTNIGACRLNMPPAPTLPEKAQPDGGLCDHPGWSSQACTAAPNAL